MSVLDPADPRKLADRGCVNSFCDLCHKLTEVRRYLRLGRIAWLCDGCRGFAMPAPAASP